MNNHSVQFTCIQDTRSKLPTRRGDTMIQKPLQKNIPLYQKAYEVIKENILIGRIRPGSKISENVLSEQLQISRTPLREAISQLKKDGLLTTDNNTTKVIELNKHDYEGLYDCRMALEKRAIKLVIKQITNKEIILLEQLLIDAEQSLAKGDFIQTLMHNSDFHQILNDACPNKWLVQFLEQIRSLLLLYRANSLMISEHNTEIIQEHRMILEAVKARNIEAATKSVEAHLQGDLMRGRKMFDS